MNQWSPPELSLIWDTLCDPLIKIRSCWLDGISAGSGFGAVDLYIGATQIPEEAEESRERGGSYVLEDLIVAKPIHLRAIGQVTDCYPRATLEIIITRDTLNQFYFI